MSAAAWCRRHCGLPCAPATEPDDEAEDVDENGPAASIKYSAKNNLAVAYIASAYGKIYLRNAGFWSTLKMDLTPFAPAVEVDSIDIMLMRFAYMFF